MAKPVKYPKRLRHSLESITQRRVERAKIAAEQRATQSRTTLGTLGAVLAIIGK